MSNMFKTIITIAALSLVTSSTHALSVEFKKNYFLGMINPKSWDGPHWWGLRIAIDDLVVSHVSGREVRSDRAGVRAFAISFKLSNVGDTAAGKTSLALHAADPAASDRVFAVLRAFEPEPDPWIVGKAVAAPALAPGDSADLSILVYQNGARVSEENEALVELEISAQ